MLANLAGLGHRDALGPVDARVAAERIGHETGDGEIYQVIDTEQLDPRNGADQVGDTGGEKGRNHSIELDPANSQHLQGKDRTGQRLRL